MPSASPPCSDAAPRAAALALWRAMGAFIATLHDLFGAPEAIAGQHTLTAAAYKKILAWLRAGEAMMRRLLLIEASAVSRPHLRPRRRAPRPRVRRVMEFSADAPQEWRVSFRCFVVPPRARPSRRRRRNSDETPEPKRFFNAWPLAERLEALLRAFNDPAPIARRLARGLNRQPHRAREMLEMPAGGKKLVGAQWCAELGLAAEASRGAFYNSS